MSFSCFPILTGSAEAQVIWGDIVKRLLIAYFISNISAKKYQNPFTCIKIIASQRWDVFLRHSVMRDSCWGQNFRTKNGRQVALTGCSRSSETWAQWTDIRAVIDREVPAWMKTMTRWTICFWVKRTSPELAAQSMNYHGRQEFLSHLLSASYKRNCSWNALRGDVRKSWLRRTALLISYFWRSFPSLPQTSWKAFIEASAMKELQKSVKISQS